MLWVNNQLTSVWCMLGKWSIVWCIVCNLHILKLIIQNALGVNDQSCDALWVNDQSLDALWTYGQLCDALWVVGGRLVLICISSRWSFKIICGAPFCKTKILCKLMQQSETKFISWTFISEFSLFKCNVCLLSNILSRNLSRTPASKWKYYLQHKKHGAYSSG